MKSYFLTSLVIVTTLMLGAVAQGQQTDERAELQQRFRARFATLVQLKRAERVGETYTAYMEAVQQQFLNERVRADDPESPTIRTFLEEENRDRRRLYQLLAEELNTTPDKVAERDAARRFRGAEPWELLKPARDAQWVRKRDLPPRTTPGER